MLGSIPLLGWLFIQLAATGLLGPATVHAAGLGALDQPVSFITICTPDGIKEIAFPGAGPETPDPKPSALGGCEWCRSLDGPIEIAGPVDTAGLALSYTAEDFVHSDVFASPGRHERDPYRVRAPPV